MLYIIGGLVAIVVIGGLIFVNTSKQFGQRPEGEDLNRISNSPLFKDNKFENPIETTTANFRAALRALPRFLSLKNGSPEKELPVKFGEDDRPQVDSSCFVTWYGHSAFLIEIEGKRILIDPMLGEIASPLPIGSKRFKYERPILIDEIDNIDIMIISHDHYDHLDYESILTLKDRVQSFVTPLGVGSHLKSWGVDADKISELDWWDEKSLFGIRLVAAPARHFSGRGITDNNATLWASWIIEAESNKLYFSGDGGYGPHFKEIGEKEGPFDLAMMECGQYDSAWANIHMMPEETALASTDVEAKVAMPIHWGAFLLGIHPWTDPIERFTAESKRLGQNIIHPMIGQRFKVGEDFPRPLWWELEANE